MSAQRRPNILLIVCDQLSARALRLYGNAVCRTPAIDRLGREGVVFENAYSNFPLCAPARFALMTGRLPSRIGAFDNAAELPAAIPTFAHYLRAAGYYTCLSGKMHFVGPDQLHGFEDRLTTEIYPSDFGWTPRPDDAGTDGDESSGVSGVDIVNDSGPIAWSMQLDHDDEVHHRARRRLHELARDGRDRPFLLTVSYTQPHDPFVITQPYWDLYDDAEIDAPRVPMPPEAGRDPHTRFLFEHYGIDRGAISVETTIRARRGYYGMISWLDARIGELTATLSALGLADDTVVMLTSDHGEMLGERGQWFKKTFFEPAIRVPLLVHAPRRFRPARRTELATLVDVLPTLVDLAGMGREAVVTPLDGASLLPALEGRALPRPNRAAAEHLDEGAPAPRIMLREDSYKLVVSPAYPPMLFDLSRDPDELRDLAGSTAHGDTLKRLLDVVAAQWDLDRLAVDIAGSRRVRWFLRRALGMGRRQSWEFEPPAESGRSYVRHGDKFPDVERRHYLPYPGR
ncbi:MAG: choline-sulfatase [Alphaproteobacteria bacterium]|nr:choline-sulfatase [Alphaproteobacteria bacterium]